MHCIKSSSKKEEGDTKKDDKLKKGIFLCLRPVVMESLGGGGGGGANGGRGKPFYKHIRVESIDGVVFPRIYHTLQPSLAPEKDAAGQCKKKSKKKLLRLMKAVLFETSLARKIKQRTSAKKKQCASGDSSAKIDNKDLYPIKATSLYKKFAKKNQERIISATPTKTVSSTASSVTSNSQRFADRGNLHSKKSHPVLEKIINKQETAVDESEKGNYKSNTGLFLLLVALLFLVIWGKILAILCTSTWLFFVPNWNSGKKLPKSRVKSQSMDREECKKKKIMEGLLGRNRN